MKGFQLYESVVMYCQHIYSHIKKKIQHMDFFPMNQTLLKS